ncbi:MAG: stage II sporulation protein M [Bacteroidetes bacterium]|nr:stage II sporulation protein M [Bacteroidota bacterium]
MREGHFIRQNKERWREYEQPTEDPDELARRFTNLVEDLSYAKTFYPSGNTPRYINGLAANIYRSIYSNRKEKGNRLILFWSEELPLIMYRNRKALLASCCFFIAFVLMGVFSAMQDQSFVRAILGDGYVDMTERNIASGDPFGVYKQQQELSMFFQIALNNIGVSFNCFILGIFCSVGTLYYLMTNGLMLGVFEYLFFMHGLGVQSILVVFVHGTLELSAIVISGMAGLVLGNSILFPKTFTRRQSIIRGAKEGIKIMVGLIPVYLLAAFFESFITRHTELPAYASLGILAASLAFVIFYFILYPARVHRRKQAHG